MPKVTIIRGTNEKPAASEALVRFFAGYNEISGSLFIGFPILGTAEGRQAIDAILLSPEKGLVAFDLVEGDPGDFAVRLDDIANRLEAKLKTHRELTKRRDLLIPINAISFMPKLKEVNKFNYNPEYLLASQETLADCIGSLAWDSATDEIYKATLSAIQNISTIRKSRVKRVIGNENSRGAKLKKLEDSIATLDSMQGKAVIETVEGVQRIRGLAGSGKTIVLALKAAYLHAQHPEWRIAVTFNTRSLKGQFRRLINNFVLDQAGEEPDWTKIRIVNAWGAPGGDERDGIYYEFTREHGLEYLDFRAARSRYGDTKEFVGVCETALSTGTDVKPLYDAVLVDEAQDFPPAFLQLCYEILGKTKRLVYAYDELQNLSGGSVPPPEEIFGKNGDGTPRVEFEAPKPGRPRQDIILQKCYRNSRPVLTTAHALGFGIYRKPERGANTGLVQMFDQAGLWQEIGYEIVAGELVDGADVTLARTNESSPEFLESHSPVEDLVQFHYFENEDAQASWLIEAIRNNLINDELRHDDIIVINPDPLTTRSRVGPIRRQLLESGISSHLAGVDTIADVFFSQDEPSITFTGIYRAKGNEAGMVYIINSQDCHSAYHNLASIRNRIFTAITRSKAWVRVLGVGHGMKNLIAEFDALKKNDFKLSFRYPTAEQRKQLAIIHRDMSAEERKHVEKREKSLDELVRDLEEGRVFAEDLSEDLVSRLKRLLDKE